ncbi:diguanylate cyclase [Micromonospora rosaria]|uniref:Diguanylate cyclase n=1 Tax=Micromonospora rosaria TaxID=47874 RepID=A0A136PWH7_9ACTN|nr:NADPH-dependent F420 reductase [Micromonospora rosaria]KXK62713.1 diguanylate cyclase [Micromonospora rosaria]
MADLTVFGTGNMGQAIAGLGSRAGRAVELIGHDDTGTTVSGDLVVLAVPYPAVAEIIEQRRDQFGGRIVVDITNPIDFETFDRLVVPPDSSAAAQIAARLPDSRVLKAFNTTFAGTLAAGTVGPLPTTVLVAGDDGDAKANLVDLVTGAGLRAVDAGPLHRARELEAMAFLQIGLASAGAVPWTGGFGVVA